MKKNIGKIDKTIRIVLGIAIIMFGANNNSVWGVIGIIPIITAQIGLCPLYSIIGINTCSNVQVGSKK